MTAEIQNITVIGGGAWGTALAQTSVQAGRTVTLYARGTDLAASINGSHENKTYLPGVRLDAKIKATADLAAAVVGADLVLLVVPTQFMRETMTALKNILPKNIPVISCSKGIEIATGKLLSEVAAEVLPGHPYAILSGPTFAHETAQGLPSAITLATADAKGMSWAAALGSRTLRPYLSTDVVGVEIAGALKNVIAIACGIVEGKNFGQNARAAVMTRGMAEIRRFGMARGAKVETFLGLAGIGDLTLTCNSMNSRNFSLGVALGQGKTLAEIYAERRSVAEGVATAKAIATALQKEKTDMPICSAVHAILHGGVPVDTVVQGLMSRDIREEDK